MIIWYIILLLFVAGIILSKKLKGKKFTYWLVSSYAVLLIISVLFVTAAEDKPLQIPKQKMSYISDMIRKEKRDEIPKEYIVDYYIAEGITEEVELGLFNYEGGEIFIEKVESMDRQAEVTVYRGEVYANGYDVSHLLSPAKVKIFEGNIDIYYPNESLEIKMADTEFVVNQFYEVRKTSGFTELRQPVIHIRIPADVEVKNPSETYIEYFYES